MKRGVHIFVGFSALAVIIISALTVDRRTFDGLKHLSWLSLLVAFVLISLALGVDAVRFKLLARAVDGKLSLRHSLEAVLAGFFVSAITPFCFGGGAIQVYILHQAGVPVGRGVAFCLIRSFLDLLVFLCGVPVLLSLSHLPEIFSGFRGVVAFVLPALLVCLFILLLKNPKRLGMWCEWGIRGLERLRKRKGKKSRITQFLQWVLLRVESFEQGIRCYLHHHKGAVALAGLLTLSITCLRFAIAPVLLRGLGGDVSILRAFLLQFFLSWMLYAAPTPGASGIAEGGFAVLFASAIPTELLPVYVLLWRFFTSFLSVGLGGFIVFYRFGIRSELMVGQKKLYSPTQVSA